MIERRKENLKNDIFFFIESKGNRKERLRSITIVVFPLDETSGMFESSTCHVMA